MEKGSRASRVKQRISNFIYKDYERARKVAFSEYGAFIGFLAASIISTDNIPSLLTTGLGALSGLSLGVGANTHIKAIETLK